MSEIHREPPGRDRQARLSAPSAVSAAILIIAGCFHLYRGVPVEAVMFCAAGIAVVAEAVGWLARPGPHLFRLPRARWSVVFGALGGVGLAVLPLRGPAETVAMAGIGVAAFGIAWCQTDVPERRLPAKGRPTAVIWACLSLALCLSQLIVYLLADPPAHEYAYPNLTVLLQPVVDQTVWRGALLALWLMAGLALLRWAGSGPGARRGR